MSQAGLDFQPWTKFKDGAYLAYLQNPETPGGGQTVEPLSTSGTGAATSTHQVDQAWTRLMRTLAISAPEHLAKVAAARTRIRNSVR